MDVSSLRRGGLLFLFLAVPLLLSGQGRESQRRTLLGYVGQEVLVVDSTSGEKQFGHADALLLYRVTLVAVMQDHLVVARNIEGDKRAFIYPLATVRRLVTMEDNHPVRPIVIEMY
jgi:hypothetical protein